MTDSTIVSIEELLELFKQEIYQPYQMPENDLTIDENFINDNDIIGTYKSSMILDHLLVEYMMVNQQQIHWQNTTHLFSFSRIIEILRIWLHPLTWIPIDKDITNKYIVEGKIAAEKLSNERLNTDFPRQWLDWILEERLRTFADSNIVAEGDMNFEGNKKVLKEMHLWHYITEDLTNAIEEMLLFGEHKQAETNPFDGDILIQNLQYIVSYMGGTRAAQLVSELRNDWKYILELKLFGIDRCTEEQISRFEYTLFRELEPLFIQWSQNQDEDKKTHQIIQLSDNFLPAETNLKELFKIRFLRTNNCQRLITFLLEEREKADDPEWRRHALELYENRDFIQQPGEFSEWLPNKFCKTFGRFVSYQPPSTIKRVKPKQSILSYLFYP